MMEPMGHLDDERLLMELYGAGSETDQQHLDACSACAGRLTRLKAQRARLLAQKAVPPDAERLRVQRAAVWAEIGKSRRRPVWRALQAGTLAGAVFVAVLLYQPARPPAGTAPAQPEVAQLADSQWFEDLATMAARETPVAAEPLMALFAAPAEEEVEKQ
jgi:hypothetical protein